MAPATRPRNAPPRVGVLMGTALLGLESAVSSTPPLVAPQSPPTPPTSGTRDTPAATLLAVPEVVPSPSAKPLTMSAN